MVENGQDCSDVLIQLAAVRSALTNTGKSFSKIIWTTVSSTRSNRMIQNHWNSSKKRSISSSNSGRIVYLPVIAEKVRHLLHRFF